MLLSQMFDTFLGDVYVDGQKVAVADLTFGEQVRLRQIVRELSPGNDDDEASSAEMAAALITVVKQRSDPNYTLKQALDLKESDLAAPPTKPAAKRTKSS